MPKPASKAARATRAAASVKVGLGPKKPTGVQSARVAKPKAVAKRIDPAIRRAVIEEDAQQRLTVMIKFDSQTSEFGKRAVSNRRGNAREKAFAQEVESLVHDYSTDHVQVLTAAANIGVATVQASVATIKDLLLSPKITGAKLMVG